MSKRKAPGYQQKREWLDARFAEGLAIKIIHEVGGRDTAFIEYIPGEYASRTVYAPGYLVIHCLWVMGRGKGKGFRARLIQEWLEDARRQGKHGVVMVVSDHVWLAGKEIFLCSGFQEVEQAPPTSQLLCSASTTPPYHTSRRTGKPARRASVPGYRWCAPPNARTWKTPPRSPWLPPRRVASRRGSSSTSVPRSCARIHPARTVCMASCWIWGGCCRTTTCRRRGSPTLVRKMNRKSGLKPLFLFIDRP